MARDQSKIIGEDASAIPELDPSRPTFQERLRRIEVGIKNMYTVERDTSLADGAGAPGTTGLGDYQKRNPK
jgi:hypothetical protein